LKGNGGLRGASEEVDRELSYVRPTTSQHSLSFSIATASYAEDECFNPNIRCLELADVLADTSTSTNTSSISAFAIATSSENLWLIAFCKAQAKAYAQAITFTKVDGDIKVEVTTYKKSKEVSLSMVLKTATKTLAYAKSEAIAKSYADAAAMSFTNVTAFCTSVNHKSPLCASGSASTDLTQVATANSTARGLAHALAMSGSVTRQNLSVTAKGASIDFINGYLAAYAKSWSYANVDAAAGTYATAFTQVANTAFAQVCVAEHGIICGDVENKGLGICAQTADEACATAEATGAGFAKAVATAVAQAFVIAQSTAETKVYLSANVDCKTRPKPQLTWASTNAGVDIICGVP
jgi:hypothetical protein